MKQTNIPRKGDFNNLMLIQFHQSNPNRGNTQLKFKLSLNKFSSQWEKYFHKVPVIKYQSKYLIFFYMNHHILGISKIISFENLDTSISSDIKTLLILYNLVSIINVFQLNLIDIKDQNFPFHEMNYFYDWKIQLLLIEVRKCLYSFISWFWEDLNPLLIHKFVARPIDCIALVICTLYWSQNPRLNPFTFQGAHWRDSPCNEQLVVSVQQESYLCEYGFTDRLRFLFARLEKK